MKRRDFSLAAASPGPASPGRAARRPRRARPRPAPTTWCSTSAAPVDAPAGKVEVVEFFWYSCPHCNAFEPQLEAWVKQAAGRRGVPARAGGLLGDDFVPQQRLYYALEAMGKVDELHAQGVRGDPRRTPAPDRRRADRWPGPTSNGPGQGQVRRACSSRSRSPARPGAPTQLQDAYKVGGRAGARRGGPLLRRRRHWPAAWTRALQVADYLVGRSAQGLSRGWPAAGRSAGSTSPLRRAVLSVRHGPSASPHTIAEQVSCLYDIALPSPLRRRSLVRLPLWRWPACAPGAGREGRPQQADEHRGRRAALRRPEADQRVHRQRGGDQGHDHHPRRAHRRAAGPGGLPVRRGHGRARQAGLLQAEARRPAATSGSKARPRSSSTTAAPTTSSSSAAPRCAACVGATRQRRDHRRR